MKSRSIFPKAKYEKSFVCQAITNLLTCNQSRGTGIGIVAVTVIYRGELVFTRRASFLVTSIFSCSRKLRFNFAAIFRPRRFIISLRHFPRKKRTSSPGEQVNRERLYLSYCDRLFNLERIRKFVRWRYDGCKKYQVVRKVSFFRKRVFLQQCTFIQTWNQVCEMSRCLFQQSKMDRT